MNVSLSEVQLITLLMCSIRTSVWLMLVPPFATAGIPKTVQTMLAVALSLPMISVAQAHAPAAELAPLASSGFEQLVIGGGLGFLTRMLFAAIESAGSIIDLVGGFSLSSAYDPMLKSQTSIFSKFYGMMVTTLIFVTPAHLVIIGGFTRSYDGIPLDGTLDLQHFSNTIIHGFSTMFVSALQIAGPLIAILFLADLALGMLSRISPQLNVFQMSFPFKILLTLGLVGMGFSLMPQTVNEIANNATGMVIGLSGG